MFTCSGGHCTTVPIDLSQGPVYLSLYGTGFRAAPFAGCQVQNYSVSAAYAGPQGSIAGLDQLNLRLPQLVNVGETDVACSFSTRGGALASALPVRINIK